MKVLTKEQKDIRIEFLKKIKDQTFKKAIISTRSGNEYCGRLIGILDSMVILVADKEVLEVSLSDIEAFEFPCPRPFDYVLLQRLIKETNRVYDESMRSIVDNQRESERKDDLGMFL